ncbi:MULTISPECIES: hypothetical protein [Bacteroides]|jgi:hypothetical protein|uniref:hypothetical protein n=2 Tax=Bacteroides TaxID=816 RepID=UPI000822E82A|nr:MULTISPECIES: hypothetical protein [Bacteroides]SCH91689.1 Uncharacterised protein [uncultured Bacteroides sp.]
MTTKQWIGIEEAAEKYQVSIRRINTWCKRQEITFSEIGHYLMLDENSLLECIERNIQLNLTKEEFERRKEKLIRENEENLFILQSLEPLTPMMRLIIKELAGMIQDENRRRMFLFVTLEGSLKKYAKESCQDFYYIQREFQILIRDIQSRIGFLKTYKDEMTHLKATLRLYEMNFGRNLFRRNDSIQEESPAIQEKENAIHVLNTPISGFEFDARPSRVLGENGIRTLRDLLKLTYKYGWNRINKLPHLGPTSVNRVINRLQQLNILDDEKGCYLYKYLDE